MQLNCLTLHSLHHITSIAESLLSVSLNHCVHWVFQFANHLTENAAKASAKCMVDWAVWMPSSGFTMDFQGDFTMGFLWIFSEIHPLTAPKKCRAKARYRRTGNPAPDSWRYIASKGASGFKTQVLINTKARCRTGPSRNSRLNWSLTYIFIISSSSSSRVVAAVLFRANPPVRPHNFLGILKEYKVRHPLNFTFNWEDQQGH